MCKLQTCLKDVVISKLGMKYKFWCKMFLFVYRTFVKYTNSENCSNHTDKLDVTYVILCWYLWSNITCSIRQVLSYG